MILVFVSKIYKQKQNQKTKTIVTNRKLCELNEEHDENRQNKYYFSDTTLLFHLEKK